MTRYLAAAMLLFALVSPAAAADGQKPPPPPPSPPPPSTAPTVVTITPPAPPLPPEPPTPGGRPRKVGPNVRVEVTLSEQGGDMASQPKTVTVTTGDGHWGRVRSLVTTARRGASPLNVDARPEVQADGRVLLALNLEYAAKRGLDLKEVGAGEVLEATLNESVTVALTSGTPLVVTQSADPMSDRKVTVEVKVTVLRN